MAFDVPLAPPLLLPQADLVKLQEQLRSLEGHQARVGVVAASELESALASVRADPAGNRSSNPAAWPQH